MIPFFQFGVTVNIDVYKRQVYAGAAGKENAFIVALKMNPMQIRISDVIARSSDEKQETPAEPQIAYLQDGAIYIDTLSRQTLTEIDV